MAKERVARTICDRCSNVFEEAEASPEDLNDEPRKAKPPLVYLEQSGSESVIFEDLCKKCTDRVESLIKDIKLEKPEKEKKPKKDSKADDKKSATKDTSEKGKPSKDVSSTQTSN